MDVVRAIEAARTDRQDRPLDDIRILNVDVRQEGAFEEDEGGGGGGDDR